MKRISAMLGAGAVAAVAATTLIATSGSAQTAPATLHLNSVEQRGVGFFPHHRPRQGDRFGFGDKISGDRTGTDRGVCTIVGKSTGICTVQVTLSDGTLSVQGTIKLTNAREKDVPFAITGGTGAYNGAKGTALINDVSETKSTIDVAFA